jgi:hypothetical protein
LRTNLLSLLLRIEIISIALHPTPTIKTNSMGLALNHHHKIQNGYPHSLYVHVRFLIRNGNSRLLCLIFIFFIYFITTWMKLIFKPDFLIFIIRHNTSKEQQN